MSKTLIVWEEPTATGCLTIAADLGVLTESRRVYVAASEEVPIERRGNAARAAWEAMFGETEVETQ